MSKKKKAEEAVSLPNPEAAEQAEEAVAEEIVSEEEKEITLSPETIEEIGAPDKELVFLKVAKAYEDTKRKRENYKKIGPAVVFITGVIFLALMFTLDNKIIFLILWIAAILYICALMIRSEYKYHKFRTYLGLSEEKDEDIESEAEESAEIKSDSEKDTAAEAPSDSNADEEQNDPQAEGSENDDSQKDEEEAK